MQPPFPQPPETVFRTLIAGIVARVRKLESRTVVLDGGSLVVARSGVIPGGYTSGQPTVMFAGQSTASGPYPVLHGYTPVAGDTVLCVPLGQGYIVMGTYA